jgi:hypothetical protein
LPGHRARTRSSTQTPLGQRSWSRPPSHTRATGSDVRPSPYCHPPLPRLSSVAFVRAGPQRLRAPHSTWTFPPASCPPSEQGNNLTSGITGYFR